jgi:tRNA U34 5-methylaminomethyl-2-thiouridine-forming methyltransferase MnmC
MKEGPTVVNTEDGSITCRDSDTGELYHNRAGAYTEALKNYIEPCSLSSKIMAQPSICLLDVCFGLGYNSFVFLDQLIELMDGLTGQPTNLEIRILGIDRDSKILEVIPAVLTDAKFDRLVNRLAQNSHQGVNSIKQALSSFGSHHFDLTNDVHLEFQIRQADIRHALPELVKQHRSGFDFIFHDGFSPRKMPELWTIDIFNLYAQLLKKHGRIMTYSSAAAVRGALTACGLEVKKTTAVGGKSGGTLAAYPGQSETDENIHDLSDTESSRLISSVPYRDPTLSDSREAILSRRQKEIAAKL